MDLKPLAMPEYEDFIQCDNTTSRVITTKKGLWGQLELKIL